MSHYLKILPVLSLVFSTPHYTIYNQLNILLNLFLYVFILKTGFLGGWEPKFIDRSHINILARTGTDAKDKNTYLMPCFKEGLLFKKRMKI
jgi:hypothetical protein